MEKLEKYDDLSLCSKCGSSGYKIKYVVKEKEYGGEALEKTCLCCGYQWYEKCINSEN